MPRGDRTGPLGEGPMTGRGLGYGAGYDSPGYTKGPGMGLGRGFFGRGRGIFGWGSGRGYFWRRSEVAPPADLKVQPDSIEQIKSDVQTLQSGLSSLLERLSKLTEKKEDK